MMGLFQNDDAVLQSDLQLDRSKTQRPNRSKTQRPDHPNLRAVEEEEEFDNP